MPDDLNQPDRKGSPGKTKVLILGGTGLLGHVMFDVLSSSACFDVYATIRRPHDTTHVTPSLANKFIELAKFECHLDIIELLISLRPDVLVNCISPDRDNLNSRDAENIEKNVYLLACLPKILDKACASQNVRFIHVSSDGVYSGASGDYSEDIEPDLDTLYAKLKFLGETSSFRGVTVRTSFIGPELRSKNAFLEWFLSCDDPCEGYVNYYFSGLTSLELSHIFRDFLIPNQSYSGLYHIGGPRVSKYELMNQINFAYERKRRVIPKEVTKIDRSLDSRKFLQLSGYAQKTWPIMLLELKNHYQDKQHF